MRTMAPADGETTEVTDGVHLTQLVAGDRTSIQHFHIEPGAVVPEHSHEHEQAGLVTSGTLAYLIGDEEFVLEAGEAYIIPGNEPHSVENRGDVPGDGIDVFSPPRADPNWGE